MEAYSLSFKVPVVIREDYTMLLELHNDLIWFHTDIRKWTPTVKAKYLEDLNLLQYLVSVPLVAIAHEDNKISGNYEQFCKQLIQHVFHSILLHNLANSIRLFLVS